MTAQKSLNKETKRSYLGFLLRQNWPTLVTNAILFLLLNVLILAFSISDTLSGTDLALFLQRLPSILQGYTVANVVLASLLAVLWGSTTMSYLNSKVGIHFYHSLPLTRESLYIREVSIKLLWFVLPFGVSCALGALTTATLTGAFTSTIAHSFWNSFLYSTTYFVVFYSIMVFASSFTGTAFTRLLAAGMVVFMPPLSILCVTYIFDYNAVYQSVDWLLTVALQSFLPARAIELATQSGYVLTSGLVGAPAIVREIACLWVLATVHFFVGALIYRKRKSERSGTPVVFKTPMVMMKYAAMFVATTFSAIVFDEIYGGGVSLAVGAVTGAFLAMILMNTILTKTAKKMFSGLRGFGISLGVFALVFALFGLDLVGLDRYVPPASAVQTATVTVGRYGSLEVEIEDREDIDCVVAFVKTYLREEEYPESSTEWAETVDTIVKEGELDSLEKLDLSLYSYASSMLRNRISFEVSFRTVLGFRYDKVFSVNINDDIAAFTEILLSDDGFEDAYFGEEDLLERRAWYNILPGGYESSELSITESTKIFKNMRSSYNGVDYFARPVYQTIYFPDSPIYDYPYYEGTDRIIDALVEDLNSIHVINTKTGEKKVYTDKAILEEILSVGVIEGVSHMLFIPRDDTYVFFGVRDGDTYDYFSAYFLKGKVPTLP